MRGEPKKVLTRKSPKSKYPKGSLPAYTQDYKKAGFTTEQAECLGQLAYAQKTVRKRLEALEAMALAQVLGTVEFDATLHMLFCAKREDRKLDCNCGAEP